MEVPSMQISLKSALKYWPALIAVVLIAAASSDLNRAYAQEADPETTESTTSTTAITPYAEFQYATITATTNTLNATLLPVVLSNGSLVYKNLTIPFKVTEDSKGNITITAGTITVVNSPETQINGFIAGNYVGPGGGNGQLITLSSPGVTASGATEWSVAQSAGATGCTYPITATFYVGPIASNPLYPRLKKAGITSTAYSYGILGEQPCGSGWWDTGTILGFAQTGNTLTIVSFTLFGNEDQNTPGDQITYTHK